MPMPFAPDPERPLLPDYARVPEGTVYIYRASNGIMVGMLPADEPSVAIMQESGNFIVWN